MFARTRPNDSKAEMANDEGLGPRKTMLVLVIVVGCFAVLWPRLLSPLLLGGRDNLKPNQFDRDAGCCEVIFETEVAVLELLSEVCSSAIGPDGKLSPYAAAECRKSVNTTCGMDIAEFLKRNVNVRKTSKALLEMMKSSNSSCLQEHFGVPVWSLTKHTPFNPWAQPSELVKQERPLTRGAGPHPAIRERGRAIPPGSAVPTPPSRGPVPLPPHARVRSPLSVYYEVEVQPPPIPGMRPPLGSAGGPVAAPKSSMGFVMPIYTICIIVFFVYTLSKILFKRTGSGSYEVLNPDPQFRRRVFRDDSRASPETKLGHKERDAIVTAISGLVAEVHQQMDASYATAQQRAQDATRDTLDELTHPHSNGGLHNNNVSVRIITTEYKENGTDIPMHKELVPDLERKERDLNKPELNLDDLYLKEPGLNKTELNLDDLDQTEPGLNKTELNLDQKEPDLNKVELNLDDLNRKEPDLDIEFSPEPSPEPRLDSKALPNPELDDSSKEETEGEKEKVIPPTSSEEALYKIKEDLGLLKEATEGILKETELLSDFKVVSTAELESEKKSREELLAEALEEALPEEEYSEEEEEELEEVEEEDDQEKEKPTVKVLGMVMSAHSADGGAWPAAQPLLPAPKPPPQRQHEAEEVKSIYLETDIPQQSRVLIANFDDNATSQAEQARHSPLVVSGKMTLSLIQDSPRATPERDAESTVDDFTTASAVTQPAIAEKIAGESDDDLEEEVEEEEIEEYEVEEIEEEEEEVQPKLVK